MAITGTLTRTNLTSKGDFTKAADADASLVIPHSLGAIPDYCVLAAVSGTEAAWRISAMDATNLTLVASAAGGTAASVVKIVAGILHSLIK